MSAEVKKQIELEIADVLFIDIVGYSKLLIDEQRDLIDALNQLVRGTGEFRSAEAAGKLMKIATGDGMVLVFYNRREAPVECALQISRALKEHPELRLRMGVHSGPVSAVVDVNERPNVAGAGINVARRVMDCGDAGHILLSQHVADDLEHYGRWRPHLHDLGECQTKHGVRVHVFNLHTDELGNPELPEKFRQVAPSESAKKSTSLKWALIIGAGVLVMAASLFMFDRFRTIRSKSPGEQAERDAISLPIPEKSIAVLPFENLSGEKENAYFTDGVQDEILTGLAKVADLKVISRTSVMQYKGSQKQNVREIAKALGVAHVLEGSVQRAGGRVRVNAQLIDARTDSQLWAERYDRDVADVFAIESEVAGKIVGQLQAKISPSEKAAMEQKPTGDLIAHDLYIRAKTLIATTVFSTPEAERLIEAVRLLNEAIERDPAFALAYYQLAYVHDVLYFTVTDHTPARLAMADRAIQSLVRLRPDSGEAHLALARHLYWGYLDYDRAREELSFAQKSLPNEPLAFVLAGFIDRRRGRWDQAIKNLERAAEIDPQNPGAASSFQQLGLSYRQLRRYPDAERLLDRAIAFAPKDAALRASRAEIELDWHADPLPLISTIEAIVAEDSSQAKNIAAFWVRGALCKRDFDGARRALAALPMDGCYDDTIPFPRFWCEGVVAQLRGDKAAASAAFTNTRVEVAKLVAQQPNYAEALCVLGMADAALGNKQYAIREGRRAVELLPVMKDAIIGPLLVKYLALIYAWTGENDLAFEQLTIAAKLPCSLSYGELLLHPYWDPLRGDPRFEKILASLAPK
jgi:TolB-like protein/class 3 adenylate cyclase/Flp pilus assembly protein TadD